MSRPIHPQVPAGPVREAVAAAVAAGVPYWRIARDAGHNHAVVRRLLWGAAGLPPTRRLRKDFADALLDAAGNAAAADADGVQQAAAASRQLQALAAAGHSLTTLAPQIGTDRKHLCGIAHGNATPGPDMRERIGALFGQLHGQPPPQDTRAQRISVTKTRAEAARHGWEPCGPAEVAVRPPAEVPAVPGTARRRRPRWHGPSFVDALAGGWDDLDPGWHPFSPSPDPFERRLDEIEEEDARWFAARAGERGEVMAA